MRLARRTVSRLTPFDDPGAGGYAMKGRRGRTFAAERADPDANVFDAVVGHIRRVQGEPRRVIIASWTLGARERLISLLADHGLKDARKVENFVDVLALPKDATAFACFGVEEGFERRISPSSPSRTSSVTGLCVSGASRAALPTF